jgi:hypothetical protein
MRVDDFSRVREACQLASPFSASSLTTQPLPQRRDKGGGAHPLVPSRPGGHGNRLYLFIASRRRQ